jgi:hypothetical protein
VSARSAGMGGVFSAVAQGTEAAFTNPAGVSLAGNPEINLSYAAAQSNSNYGLGGYVHPLAIAEETGYSVVVGAGIVYYTAGNMDVNYADGTTRSFNAERSYSGGVSISGKYRFIAFGISPKLVRSTLVEQFTGSAYAVDAGVMLFPFPEFFQERCVIGASVQNLGSKISYKNAEFALPAADSAGLGIYILQHPQYGALLVSGQLEKTMGEVVRYRTGGEWSWSGETGIPSFFLRGGYRINFDSEDYSVGIGLREKNLGLDYAFTNSTDLENKHLVTLSFRFGEVRTKKQVQEDPDFLKLRKTIQKEEQMELIRPDEKLEPIPEKEFKTMKDSDQPKLIQKEFKPEDTNYQLIK